MAAASKKVPILIVDDDPNNQQVLGSLLVKNGYQVTAAQSGQQALDFVQKKIPAAILLDVMMPKMDGFEVCRQLKANEASREIPVLFITALSDMNDKLKAFTEGGADYITKPFIEEEVLARLKVHLENRKLLTNMMEANQNLADLNQLKNKFLGIAAHDLRNPLTSIIGFSDMLITGDFGEMDDEPLSIIKVIESAGTNMLSLVNDLLDVSIIELGKLTLKLEMGSLKKLIEDRIAIGKVAADKKQIALISSLEDIPNFKFDPNRMAQVVDNLLSNAIKFSSSGTEIKINLLQADNQIILMIQDQGQGISEKDQSLIFGEFQKLSSKPTAGEKSTGLGMAITKKFIDAHLGKIHVDSKLGEGATFTVNMPLNLDAEKMSHDG
jgi:two-component system sensor histidine kinase/response regulator